MKQQPPKDRVRDRSVGKTANLSSGGVDTRAYGLGETVVVPVPNQPCLVARYDLGRLRHRLAVKPVPASLEGWAEFLVATVEELVTLDGAGFEQPLWDWLCERPPVRFDARLVDPFDLWIADTAADSGRRMPQNAAEFLCRLMGGEVGVGRHVTDLVGVLGDAGVPVARRPGTTCPAVPSIPRRRHPDARCSTRPLRSCRA